MRLPGVRRLRFILLYLITPLFCLILLILSYDKWTEKKPARQGLSKQMGPTLSPRHPLKATSTLPSPSMLRTDYLAPLPGEPLSKRWIVVTSVQPPTYDLTVLGKLSRFGWRVLVVGDMSSPPDYVAPEGVRFLSYKEAITLGYNLLAVQRWKFYAVKNIGYLFAIQHGAEVVYDTDDDNHPTDELRTMLELSGYANDKVQSSAPALVWSPEPTNDLPTINPLPHFGHSTMWPRGFPLGEISRQPPHTYKICSSPAPSWIQGVVNGDPDVDAIFRLTRKHFNTPINLTFDSAPPVVAPEGIFLQSNSQNTFFAKSALPVLFFPFSYNISFRETDIWRGYIGQPLLWLVGGRKAYIAPNAFTERSPHDYLKDFKEESNLYSQSGNLIRFLAEWSCPVAFDFARCFVRLYEDLTANSIVTGQLDIDGAKAWISDLKRMHFDFPLRKRAADCLIGKESRQVQFFPIEQKVPLPAKPKLKETMAVEDLPVEWSSLSAKSLLNSIQLFSPVVASHVAVLVFSFTNGPVRATTLQRLEMLYQPYFARRIVCVKSPTEFTDAGKLSLVEARSTKDCLEQVSYLRFNTSVFVLISPFSPKVSGVLLSPSGIDKAVHLASSPSDQNPVFAGPCSDKVEEPSVLMVRSNAVSMPSCSSIPSAQRLDWAPKSSCRVDGSKMALLVGCQTFLRSVQPVKQLPFQASM